MYSYKKTEDSPYDPAKLEIPSILGPEIDPRSTSGRNLKQTVSNDDIVQCIDENNIVTCVDFHRGITFFTGASEKVGQINQETRNISRSCEKPKCIPNNDHDSCSIDEENSSDIFLNPYNLRHMDSAALMAFIHSTVRDSMFHVQSVSSNNNSPTSNRLTSAVFLIPTNAQ